MMGITTDWNPETYDDLKGVEASIVGYYDVDGRVDVDPVTVVGVISPDTCGGFSWALEDAYIGFIDGGYATRKHDAKRKIFRRAKRWIS